MPSIRPSIPDPGFAGDDGAVAEEVAGALAAYDVQPDTLHDATLEVLQRHRLLVPVVAVLGEAEVDERGVARDKTSDMATVLMRGRDGRTALLAFTGQEPMRRWDAQARPVPVTLSTAARAAAQDGAAAILVDVAGPVVFVVESADLTELAAGRSLVQVEGRFGWLQTSAG